MPHNYSQDPAYGDFLAAEESERALPPGIGYALMMAESSGDPRAQSPTGPKGLMQMSRAAIQDVGGGDPFDPYDAGRMGLTYFEKMLNQFQDVPTAIAAYHDGPGAISSGKPWSAAATNHVKKVMGGMPNQEAVDGLLSMLPEDGAVPDIEPEDEANPEAVAGMLALLDETPDKAGALTAPASPQDKEGFLNAIWPAVNRFAGHILLGPTGTLAEEAFGKNQVSDTLYGMAESIIREHPSLIEEVEDLYKKPGTAVGEVVAEQLPQLALTAGMAKGGAALGAVGGPIGVAVGSAVGATASMFFPAYADIIERQKATGKIDRQAALTGAIGITLLERFGLEKFAKKLGHKGLKGLKEELGLLPAGKSRIVHAVKGGVKAAITEGPLTEAPQEMISQYAGGQDPLSAESLKDTKMAAAKGALGGGVIGGGIAAMTPREQANQRIEEELNKDVLPPNPELVLEDAPPGIEGIEVEEFTPGMPAWEKQIRKDVENSGMSPEEIEHVIDRNRAAREEVGLETVQDRTEVEELAPNEKPAFTLGDYNVSVVKTDIDPEFPDRIAGQYRFRDENGKPVGAADYISNADESVIKFKFSTMPGARGKGVYRRFLLELSSQGKVLESHGARTADSEKAWKAVGAKLEDGVWVLRPGKTAQYKRPEFQSFSHDLEDIISNPKSPGYGTADAAFKRIEEIAESPWQKKIAQHLRELNLGATIRMRGSADLQVVDPRSGETVEAMGQFWRSQNIIDVHTGFLDEGGVAMGARGMARTIVHEGVHAGTHLAIDSGGTIAKKWLELYKYASGMTRGLERQGYLAEGVSKQYGWADAHEFAAEGFSNPDFQEVLKDIPALNPTGKVRTLWDQFLNTVRISVGLPANTPRSVLDEVIEGGLDLVKLQKKMTPRQKFAAGMSSSSKAQLDDWAKGMARDIRAKQLARGMDPAAAEKAYRGNYIKLRQQAVDQYHKDSEGAPEEFAEAAKLPGVRDAGLKEAPTSVGSMRVPGSSTDPTVLEKVSDIISKVSDKMAPFFGGQSIRHLDQLTQFSPTLRDLRQQFKHYEQADKALRPGETAGPDYNERVNALAGRYTKAFEDIIDPLRQGHLGVWSQAAREAFAQALKSGSQDVISVQTRTLLDRFHTAMEHISGKTIGYRDNYFPVVYRRDYLSSSAGERDFIEARVAQGMTEEDAYMALQNIIDNDGVFFGTEAHSSGRSFTRRRTLPDLPPDAARRMTYTEPRDVLRRYFQQGAKFAEAARILGPNGEKLDQGIERMKKEFQAAGRVFTHDNQDLLRNVARALIGQYHPIRSNWIRIPMRFVGAAQLVLKMPYTAITSLAEPILSLEYGPKAFKAGFFEAIGYASQQAKRIISKKIPKGEARKILEDLHFITDTSIVDMLQSFKESAAGRVSGMLGADVADVAGLAPGRGVELFFKATQLEAYTNGTRAWALGASRSILKETIGQFAKAPGGVMEERLRGIGLDPKEAVAWMKRTGGDITAVDVYQSTAKLGIQRLINDVVMNPNAMNSALWKSDQRLYLFQQLSRFTGTFGNTITRRWLHKFGQSYKSKEEAEFAGYALGAAVFYMLGTAVINELQEWRKWGSEGNPYTKKDKPGDKAIDAFLNSGIPGALVTHIRTAEDLSRPTTDLRGKLRFLGPGPSQLADIFVSAVRADGNMLTEELLKTQPWYTILTKAKQAEVKEAWGITKKTRGGYDTGLL